MSTVRCRVSERMIEPNDVFQFIRHPGHGAQNFFFGAVRSGNRGRTVVAVHYDAFESLAIRTLQEICFEAQAKWANDGVIYVAHRTGRLGVGEISVGIGVSSRHRDEAYQASRYIIEQIKLRAPIWKKEVYEDGETEWLKGHALCQHGNEGEHASPE